jgi:hypothetical protein
MGWGALRRAPCRATDQREFGYVTLNDKTGVRQIVPFRRPGVAVALSRPSREPDGRNLDSALLSIGAVLLQPRARASPGGKRTRPWGQRAGSRVHPGAGTAPAVGRGALRQGPCRPPVQQATQQK